MYLSPRISSVRALAAMFAWLAAFAALCFGTGLLRRGFEFVLWQLYRLFIEKATA
jgi:hypothetical protein